MQRSNYFYGISIAFLLIVFFGFAPSFYLKFLVGDQEYYPEGLPVPHMVHGFILTTWYVFLVLQTRLIQSRRAKVHMQLGWFGVSWSVLVVLSTCWVISVFPARMQWLAEKMNSSVDHVEPGLASILWMDVFMTIMFIVCIAGGIINRKKPAIHKRLMLYSGIAYLFAATYRIGGNLSYETKIPILGITGTLTLLLLTGSLFWHDWKRFGKILPVSWQCFIAYWILTIGAKMVGNTAWGKDFILSIFD
jgi:hypothetical protein